MTQPNEAQLSQIFEEVVEGKLVSEERLSLLQRDSIWSKRLAIHLEMSEVAEQMSEIEVPNWRREQGFELFLAKPSWWQAQGLSLVALSFSIFACFILLFDVRIVDSTAGTQIVWGDTKDQQWLEQQFDQLAEQNHRIINSRLNDLATDQQADTAQLASYLMDNSRLERKEDIQDVVRVIQQQRQDDMLYLQQQFSDVNYNIRVAAQRQSRSLRNTELNGQNESQISE